MEQSYLEFHPKPYILPDILYYNTPLSYFQHSNYMTKKPKAIADKALHPHFIVILIFIVITILGSESFYILLNDFCHDHLTIAIYFSVYKKIIYIRHTRYRCKYNYNNI